MRRTMLEFLETCWDQPDEGIWEVRGPARQFTHSKVMAWVAFDRAVRRLEAIGDAAAPTGLASSDGALCALACMQRSARAGSTPSSARSCSRTARRASTRACSWCPSSASCLRPIRASAGPCARSRRACSREAWCAATRPTRASTACRGAKASFSRARSGSPTTGRSWTGRPRPPRSSSASSGSATTWVCSPRSTTCPRGGSWATSPKPSRTCRWSTARAAWATTRAPRGVAARATASRSRVARTPEGEAAKPERDRLGRSTVPVARWSRARTCRGSGREVLSDRPSLVHRHRGDRERLDGLVQTRSKEQLDPLGAHLNDGSSCGSATCSADEDLIAPEERLSPQLQARELPFGVARKRS